MKFCASIPIWQPVRARTLLGPAGCLSFCFLPSVYTAFCKTEHAKATTSLKLQHPHRTEFPLKSLWTPESVSALLQRDRWLRQQHKSGPVMTKTERQEAQEGICTTHTSSECILASGHVFLMKDGAKAPRGTAWRCHSVRIHAVHIPPRIQCKPNENTVTQRDPQNMYTVIRRKLRLMRKQNNIGISMSHNCDYQVIWW